MQIVHKSRNEMGGFEVAIIAVLFDTANYTAVLKEHEKVALEKFFECF